jgi:hypothetical protein
LDLKFCIEVAAVAVFVPVVYRAGFSYPAMPAVCMVPDPVPFIIDKPFHAYGNR